MPTYEYVCTSCQTPLEVVQSIHEPSLTDCPACGDGRLRKVFGNVGVVFKGSGFYRTDSRSKSAAGSAATPSKESKESKESTRSSEAGGTGAPGATPAATSENGQVSTGSKSSTKSSEKAAAAAAS